MKTEKKQHGSPRFIGVDFFCGAGGTTRGLISAGGYILAGLDNDVRCKETYQKNNKNRFGDQSKPAFLPFDLLKKSRKHPSGQQHQALEALRKIVATAKRSFPRVPLLFSICAPCQPFARLYKKKISRKRLLKHVRDRSLLLQCSVFVETFRPDMILCENVAAITSSKYGDVWERFNRKLQYLGYKTGADVINAVNFGVPQNRERSLLIALKSKRKGRSQRRAAEKKSLPVPKRSSAEQINVRQAIGHLPRLKAGGRSAAIPNHVARGLTPLNIRRLLRAKPGESNVYMEKAKSLGLKCHRKMNRKLKQRCFNDVYTRMHPDRPAPTITTRCLSVSNGRFGHYAPKQVRAISMREAALLQSFPKRYVFYPTDKIEPAARMIGNAVPPKLARFFARHLLSLRYSKSAARTRA